MKRSSIARVATALTLAALAASSAANAQRTQPEEGIGFLIGGGAVAQLTSDGGAMLPGMGVAGGVELFTGWGPKLRAEAAVAQFVGEREVERSCTDIRVCGQRRTTRRVFSATASGEFRPIRASRRFYAIAGIGIYNAFGVPGRYDSVSIGLNGGIGRAFDDWDRGVAVELRYHWLESDIGLTAGFVPLVVTYRF